MEENNKNIVSDADCGLAEAESGLADALILVDALVDDADFVEAEFNTVRDYCQEHHFHLTKEDMDIVIARGYGEDYEVWKARYDADVLEKLNALPETTKAHLATLKRYVISEPDACWVWGLSMRRLQAMFTFVAYSAPVDSINALLEDLYNSLPQKPEYTEFLQCMTYLL